MSRTAQIVLLLACTAGGVVVGRATVDPAPDHPPRTDRPMAALTPPAVPVLGSDALRGDIRRILREELQLARQPEPVQAAIAAAPATPPPESAEAVAAAEQGHRIVDGALAAQRWGDQDVTAIRQILPQLAADDRDALLKQLVPAINTGRVRLETVGQIF
jgi:hypothetical protein